VTDLQAVACPRGGARRDAPAPPGGAAGPLRVLYLDNSFTFGGAINSLVHLLRGLDPARVRPVVVTGQPREFVEAGAPGVTAYQVRLRLPWTEEGGWRNRFLSLPPFRLPGVRQAVGAARVGAWFAFRTLPEALRYVRIGRRHGVDVVHLNNSLRSQPAGVLAARILGVPCVVHSRGIMPPHWSLRLRDRQVAHHVAISDAVRDSLVAAGIAPERITRVHNGIDLDEFDESADPGIPRREFGIREGERTFGLFGRIVPWKGTLEFVRAAHRVLQAHPESRAFVVGSVSDGGEAYMEQVRGAIRQLGLEDRVVLTGYRRDVPALMKMMDVVVHASTEPEPFGRVLIEGMAMGKPIVATEGGGPDEVVLPGRTGFLVPRGDADALGDAIARVLADPGLAAEMGACGRERVLLHFTKESCAEQVMQVYARVLAGRASTAPAE
jgi:glycosyltransferase involved in cell wall biosynthesis